MINYNDGFSLFKKHLPKQELHKEQIHCKRIVGGIYPDRNFPFPKTSTGLRKSEWKTSIWESPIGKSLTGHANWHGFGKGIDLTICWLFCSSDNSVERGGAPVPLTDTKKSCYICNFLKIFLFFSTELMEVEDASDGEDDIEDDGEDHVEDVDEEEPLMHSLDGNHYA
jgi:hypothetical protein